MKLTIPREKLAAALAGLVRVVERRSTIPILQNIRLVARDGRLEASATDLELAMTVAVGEGVAVLAEGETTVEAARLGEIARKLPAGAEVTLALAEDGRAVKVTAGRARFDLLALPAADFPDLEGGDFPARYEIDAATLAAAIAATEFAISDEETRYYLNGIYLHTAEAEAGADAEGRAEPAAGEEGEGGRVLRLVATDGHRLAQRDLAAPAGAEGAPGVIVPRKAIAEAKRLAATAEKGAVVEIAVSETKIRFRLGEAALTSKLIDGVYPDYRRVIPRRNARIARLDRAALAAAADRVGTIAEAKGRAVRMDFAERGLTLAAKNPDAGEASEEIDCAWQGDPLAIGFNGRYVGDCLSVFGAEAIELALDSPGAPALLRAPGDESLLVVLMPMRV